MPTAIRFITRMQDTDDWADLDAVQFVSMAASAFVTNERILTGTANQVIVTDGGAGGNVTLSTPQNIDIGASPQFAGLGIGTPGVAGILQIVSDGIPIDIQDSLGNNIFSITAASQIYIGSAADPLAGIYGRTTGFTYYQCAAVDFHHHFYTRTNAGASLERLQIQGGAVLGNVSVLNSYFGVGTAAPATNFESEEIKTLTGNLADDYAAAVTLDPGYTAAYTVTRHNYIDVQDVSVAAGAAVTNAAVMRFDANIGAHKALAAAFTTTDSNGDTTNWATGVLININGVLYKLPAIAA